ncbi:PTS system, cellobiose-specific IIB component [Williamsoniiplasma somnilux]|uniref:PTS system, cellobiose-specific IIB component n=1 Tax=Williamsoniiplasma somnilux TaxID=215578 RepID=A0A2K8NZD6_9MOLU|nr:PTS cellobiose IIB component [Williamsoniiplasma somnilux]ATZ18916.1 PTS system, cellobiose-specific IIB component [Williamsoniiplasma somnilux]
MSKKILLVCSAGMSTSMLVKKMEAIARKENLDYEIKAMGMAEAKPIIKNWDVIMVGPQVSFILNDLKSMTSAPVELIPANIYALAKGEEAIKMAQKLMSENK